MQKMKLTKGETSSKVYIILRVFNLDKENIGMRLYVDPASMETRGELQITEIPGTPRNFSVHYVGAT